jgi:energy-coupling factor transport system substrate-specific component
MQRRIKLQEAELALARQQVQMGNETILAIAKTVDAKDERTSKHSQRVSEYSRLIAKEYGFTEKEQENIRNAALLHDIGKIGIPDSVLNKPGRLTDEEYTIMKTHVTRGAEILKDFTLIDHVVEGARYHHERYDGKGYPDHLAGEEIPLYGRIISIADAFDAMTANRVYRKRQDFDYVMGELHKGRGTQFDPELLDIFLKLIDEKKIDIDAIYTNAPAAPEENKADLKPKSVEEAKQ